MEPVLPYSPLRHVKLSSLRAKTVFSCKKSNIYAITIKWYFLRNSDRLVNCFIGTAMENVWCSILLLWTETEQGPVISQR